MPEKTLEPAVPLKLKSIDDLVRLVNFWTMRERTATILHFKKGEKHILGTFTALPGYYNLEGLPLFLYVETNKAPKASFIKYRSDPTEEWDYTDGTFDRKYLFIPLITLEKVPVFLSNI